MSTADALPTIDDLPIEKDGVPVRETLRALFNNTENGKPNAITKAGCLALALKSTQLGRAAPGHSDESSKTHILWNAWREAFPSIKPDPIEDKWVNAVDFADVDFRAHDIDFSCCHFGDATNFTRAQWGDNTNFSFTKWGNGADFSFTKWGNGADFSFTKWGNGADFSRAQWNGSARFAGALFGHYTNFFDTQFLSEASFTGAQFGVDTVFYKAKFRSDAFFDGVLFGQNIIFLQAEFHARAYFAALSWEQVKNFVDAEDESFESGHARAARLNASPDCFQQVDFRGAQFLGIPAPNGVSLVDFSGRRFLGRTLFCSDGEAPAIFNSVPKMHGCQIYPDTRIVDAVFPRATGSEDAIGAYRSLRCAFNRNQAFREEQFFFRLEMEEEAQRTTRLKRWLFGQYKCWSNYGLSVGCPLFGLILLPLPLFAVLYLWFTTMANPDWDLAAITSDTLWHQLLRLSVTAALPVPGTDLARELRTELFGTGGVASLALLLEMFQKTLSLAGLFLAGLALRNLFKLK